MNQKYPYEPDGAPVERVELALADVVEFQDPEDKGLWSKFRGFHIGEFIASHHIFADRLGDNIGFDEVAIETETPGVIEEGKEVTIRRIVKNNKGKIVMGAVVGVSVVAAGTLRAVYKSRDNS